MGWKIAIIVIVIVLGVVLLLIAGLAIGLMLFATHPKCQTEEQNINDAIKNNVYDEYLTYKKEEVVISSFDGYKLHGWLIRNTLDKYVIITHGYIADHWTVVKYAVMYYRMGYGVFLYDLRHFGINKKTYCSLGHNEPKDLLCVIQEIRKIVGDSAEIGLHGESLGAASTVMVLDKTDDVKFAVCDCPFSDLGILLENCIHQVLHMPKQWSHLASYASMVFHHYRMDRVCPYDVAKKIDIPIMFIHGGNDQLIDNFHSKRMYDVTNGYKKFYIMEGANHAQSFETDPDCYTKLVKEFLDGLA